IHTGQNWRARDLELGARSLVRSVAEAGAKIAGLKHDGRLDWINHRILRLPRTRKHMSRPQVPTQRDRKRSSSLEPPDSWEPRFSATWRLMRALALLRCRERARPQARAPTWNGCAVI